MKTRTAIAKRSAWILGCLLVWGCAATVPLEKGFQPALPVIDYSRYEKDAPLEMVVQTNPGSVDGLAFSPDGKFVAVAGGQDVQLWSIDGLLVKNIQGGNSARRVAFIPDGQAIVSGGSDGITLSRIDGQRIWKKDVEVFSLAVSPDGKRIAAGTRKKILLWSVDGQPLREWEGSQGILEALVFSPDGNWLVSGANDKTIRIWTLEGKLLNTLEGHTDTVSAIALRPDGQVIASGSHDKTIRLWSRGGSYLRTLAGHSFWVKALAFTPDGKTLASAGGTDVFFWDPEGKRVAQKKFFADSLAFSPDQKMIALWGSPLGGLHQMVHLCDLQLKGITEFTSRSSDFICDVAFSPEGNLAIGFFSEIDFWEADGALHNTVRFKEHLNRFLFTPRGDIVAVGEYKEVGKNAELHIMDDEGAVVKVPDAHPDYILALDISPDGERVASVSMDRVVKLWSRQGRLLKTLKGHDGIIDTVAFSPDGRRIASGSRDQTVKIWDGDGNLLNTLKAHTGDVRSLAFSPDGKVLASSSLDKTLRLWDARGALLRTLTFDHAPGRIAFSADGRMMAVALDDHSIRLVDGDGRIVRTLTGHTAYISKMAFRADGRLLVSGSHDSTLRMWNLQTGDHVALLSAASEWILFTPDGYFDASKNGGSLISMVKGFRAFGVDQLALKYNRPDILLERLGAEDPEWIAHYNRQYRKRLRRAGIDEEKLKADLPIPEVRILAARREGKFIHIDFDLSDSHSNLTKYNIYANDVPLFGSGKEITGRSVQLTEKVELTSGLNKIEIGAVNESGTESYRVPLTASYEEVQSNLYFLGFGISKYRDSSLNLGFADKDAADLARLFSSLDGQFVSFRSDWNSERITYLMKRGDLWNFIGQNNIRHLKGKQRREIEEYLKGETPTPPMKVFVKTYLNEEVSVANIRQAKDFLKGARPDDIFILFIAGHGVHDPADESTYYYLTYETDLKNLAQTAANFELIEDLLQNIAPRRKLFFMDTCESGEVDDDLERQYMTAADSRGIKARASRAIKLTLLGSQTPRAGKRLEVSDWNRYIYNDLMRRSGAIVFSSSRGNEFSYESEKLQNGFFTRAIMDAITTKNADKNEDGLVSMEELRGYLSETVAEQTGGAQHPTVDRDNIYQKIGLPLVQP